MTERIHPFVPEHLDSNESPRKVVHETGTLLPIYFGDLFDGEDTRYAINYFGGPTLTFISDTTRGFLLSRDLIRTQVREKGLERIMGRKELITGSKETEFPHVKSLESYGLTLVILSQMAHWTQQPRYFWGLSRSLLTVPHDSMEMLDRLEELREFVTLTARQEVTPRNLDRTDDATQRSLAFFQVGKDLAVKIKEPSTLEEEISRILRETPMN
ncbi:MAG TPA: hypothetical protein VFA93_02955 [Patescibacteria group bacterium]|nr:hypothetical protein [Patescibacteria group bacterium]